MNPTAPELLEMLIEQIKADPSMTLRWGEAMILVGEIDRLRERVAELESQVKATAQTHEHSVDDLVAHMDILQARVVELEVVERKALEQSEYIQAHGLTEYEMARLKAQVETTTWYNGTLLTELSTLREQLAELEADAALGRMVREMPLSAKLGHEGQQWGEWYATWTSSRRHGPTPEAALEAARKGET